GWCEDFTGRTHWVGVLEPSETGYLGLARYDNNVSWIQKLSGQANFSIPTLLEFEEEFGTAIVPPSIPRSGSILAQELGHNYNRRHVDCGGPDDIDASYPYNTRYTYDETVEGHWGFDHRRMGSLLYEQWALIRKETLAADFMSYCAPGWVSDYTYRALLDASGGVSQDGGGAAVIVVPFAPTDQILTVGALVTPEHSHGEELGEPHAEITQIRLIHGDALSARKRIELARLAASLDAPKSPWTVDLVRDDDTLLVSYPFAPPESPGEHHGELSIIFPVRFENGAERILIRYHGDTLAEVEVSRNWPIVEVVSPNGGEELPQDLTIEWTSSDPDGDELTHDIQYSPDGGESWYVVAQNVVGTSYSLADPSSIPGSAGAALVRVVASDGVRSQADVSDAPFHLGFRAPRAFISRPRPGEVLAHGETIVLEGGATDPEELDLSENQLSWLVDGKAFGTGAELAIAGLGIGPHTAEVRALDSNQKGSTARVDFWIGRRACPPSDQRMEIVWLIESSDLMEMHEREVCAKIASTVSHLESMGLTVESTVATMLEGGRCADTSVPEIGDKGVVFTGLEWHEGVETIASRHEWTQGTRVIVPIVKQAPKSLSSYPSLIASAAKVANANGIHVAPWLVPLLDGPVNPNARSMAEAFAAATGGIVLEWDSPANPVEIFSLKLTGNCRPEVHGVEPTGPVDPNRPVVVFGEDLRPGVIVEIGGRPAREVEYGPDGSWIRFRLPFGLDLLEEHKLEVGRPGQRSVEAPQSIVVSTGDVTPPEIVCPQSRRVRCESDEGATVEFVVSATDAVDPSPTIVCEPPSGSLFPIGTTIVKCAATDASGNEATCIFEVTVLCTDDASFRRGDANADGRVDLSDALFSLGALFLGGSAHSCPDAGDTNDDNKIDITDPIAVLQFLFVGGAPPASPGHATCGLD
ncbi:MAG TPA: HYR domain-containing protein, partial [Planctomycetota bacterium]|nr:HYR domain-containing protein [Planctomycetota bacterium]